MAVMATRIAARTTAQAVAAAGTAVAARLMPVRQPVVQAISAVSRAAVCQPVSTRTSVLPRLPFWINTLAMARQARAIRFASSRYARWAYAAFLILGPTRRIRAALPKWEVGVRCAHSLGLCYSEGGSVAILLRQISEDARKFRFGADLW